MTAKDLAERYIASFHARRRRARLRHARRRAARDRAHAGDVRADRAPDRGAASPIRWRATSTSRSAGSPATASSRSGSSTTCMAGRARRGRRAQARRARLRALEGGEAGRAVVGEPVGPGASRLAPRVLGDERPSISASRSTCTAAARTSSSRTTRTRSRSPRAPPGSPSCATGCTTPSCASTTRRWSKSLGNFLTIEETLKRVPAEALRLFLARHALPEPARLQRAGPRRRRTRLRAHPRDARPAGGGARRRRRRER